MRKSTKQLFSVGNVVFLQPLGNRAIRSNPDYLIECEVTKVGRKYLYLRPTGSDLPSDYARVERETYEYYDYDGNYGWMLWPSQEDFIKYKTDIKALECTLDLCQSVQSMIRWPEARLATQLASEQINSVCSEMIKLVTSIRMDLSGENHRKEEIITAAQSAVQSYLRGEIEPYGLRPACHLIEQIVKGKLQ